MTGVLSGAVALVLSLSLPLALKPLLLKLGVLDIPNERSSHTKVVVRGMGITVAVGVPGGLLTAVLTGAAVDGAAIIGTVAGVCAAAALLGWLEDFRGVAISVRFLLQLAIGAAGTAIIVVLTDTSWLWIPVGALAIAGYINVANFMDGVNGISGLHGLVVGLLFSVAGMMSSLDWLTVSGLVVAAAFAAFLPWNLSGSNFLGDVGSYLLGASLAVLGAAGFLSGVQPEYLLGPVTIYLADTMTTLLRRISAGERWYAAHRQHVYQRLTDVGLSHVQSALVVAVCSLLTGLCGFVAAGSSIPGKASALLVCAAVVLFYLRSPRIFGRRAADAATG
jgi:UDP-N-acetylmuramyl pentapeptide phosphotransferase/UDP-N-acetylglucosamine-1-phosphate transferase